MKNNLSYKELSNKKVMKIIMKQELKIKVLLIVICCLLTFIGCKNNTNLNNNEINNSNIKENDIKESEVEVSSVKVIINDKIYTLLLDNNNTAKEFINLLPQEFNMNELNGNEKYVYMDNSLSTNSYKPKQIKKGDVMLYGDNCLVIFYKSFSTSYSYTKIGHIDNLEDLGNKSVDVKFEK